MMCMKYGASFFWKRAVALVALLSFLLLFCIPPAFAQSNSQVWAWGRNQYGQLGDGTFTERDTPVLVTGLTDVVAIAGGLFSSLALKSDGTVWSWGDDLGNGTNFNSNIPVLVNGLTDVVAIAGNNLVLKSDGTVWSWGINEYGQLGDGTTTNRNIPVQVSGLTGVVAIAGGGDHTLAVMPDGTIWAWGENQFGQLGLSTFDGDPHPIPMQVSGLTNVVAIACGYYHSHALKSDGTVWSWGLNDSGKLGDGTTTNRNTPVQVSGLTNVVAITAGTGFSLALKSDGTVWGWGSNFFWQIGQDPFDKVPHPIPLLVIGLTDIVAISAGDLHSMALKSDGTAWSWGRNSFGQLGHDGHFGQVSGLTNVVAIAAGGVHSLALTAQNVLQGSVMLQSFIGFGVPIHFEFRPVGGGSPILRTVNTGPAGAFSFTDIPIGTYNVAIKGDKWLQQVVPNVSTVGGNVLNLNVTLLGGDADNNNVVDFDDLTVLAIAYNTVKGDVLYDNRADFNCDGQVEFADLTLLAINYNLSGDP